MVLGSKDRDNLLNLNLKPVSNYLLHFCLWYFL